MGDFLFTFDGQELLEKVRNGRLFYVPFKTSIDDWVKAVKAAILKRCEPLDQISVDLSSGYESGVIFNEVAKLNRPFMALTIMGNEDPQVVYQRVAKAPHCAHTVLVNTAEDIQRNVEFIRKSGCLRGYYAEFKDCGNPYLLESSGGELNTARINEEVRRSGRTIRLSGLGDQYMLEDFTGRQNVDSTERDFLECFLYPILSSNVAIDRAYGIETRYPFLDPRVVQEYLYLTDGLKMSMRKAPMELFLAYEGVPVMKNAPGFHLNGWKKPIKELYDL